MLQSMAASEQKEMSINFSVAELSKQAHWVAEDLRTANNKENYDECLWNY